MNADKANILVIPTWAGGKTEQWLPNVGPGKMADTSKYYVILIDALSLWSVVFAFEQHDAAAHAFSEDHNARHG